jgi:hypothetical protein
VKPKYNYTLAPVTNGVLQEKLFAALTVYWIEYDVWYDSNVQLRHYCICYTHLPPHGH